MSDKNSSFGYAVQYLSPFQAADFLAQRGLGVARTTLAKLRCLGGGPPFHRYGRKILYRPDEILEWADQRISQSHLSTSTMS